jgi:hypothetical protein
MLVMSVDVSNPAITDNDNLRELRRLFTARHEFVISSIATVVKIIDLLVSIMVSFGLMVRDGFVQFCCNPKNYGERVMQNQSARPFAMTAKRHYAQ